jgi:hypothetical protein
MIKVASHPSSVYLASFTNIKIKTNKQTEIFLNIYSYFQSFDNNG